MTCTDPIAEMLTPLSQGQLDAEDSGRVLEHVETCPACSEELDFLADVVTAVHADVAAESARPGRLLRFPLWTMGLAAAAALVLLLGPRLFGPDGTSVAGHAQWSRPSYTVIRDLPDPLTFEGIMLDYSKGEDAAVEAGLSQLIATETDEPDARAFYYRAAARFELGRIVEARQDLERTVELASGALREHATWRLANVHLKLEDRDQAVELLDAIAADGGAFAELATGLLEDLP